MVARQSVISHQRSAINNGPLTASRRICLDRALVLRARERTRKISNLSRERVTSETEWGKHRIRQYEMIGDHSQPWGFRLRCPNGGEEFVFNETPSPSVILESLEAGSLGSGIANRADRCETSRWMNLFGSSAEIRGAELTAWKIPTRNTRDAIGFRTRLSDCEPAFPIDCQSDEAMFQEHIRGRMTLRRYQR